MKPLSPGAAVYFSLVIFSVGFYILFYFFEGYFPKSMGMPLVVTFIGSGGCDFVSGNA